MGLTWYPTTLSLWLVDITYNCANALHKVFIHSSQDVWSDKEVGKKKWLFRGLKMAQDFVIRLWT